MLRIADRRGQRGFPFLVATLESLITTTVLVTLALVCGIASELRGQASLPASPAEVEGSFSGYRYDAVDDSRWRLAGTLRARVHIDSYLHAEATATMVPRDGPELLCPGGGCVFREDPFTLTTVGAGGHLQLGLWQPFAGLGVGRAWGAGGSRPVFESYLGFRRYVAPSLAISIRHRLLRARWMGGTAVTWDQSLSFGLALSVG